ncbi:DUF4870 domain-containing protein [Paenibacillus sp.]|uniref:DUF4870 domain-containing protein n=1 Tax=Paenibacillus sp. TaxID=58172 RepID=UPI002D697371|nr:DUF4870 domain-containing protein [Paenibacillus sp.]HZG84229.1 DUF4870 domain-containing protein [Paenibacillus sp.]
MYSKDERMFGMLCHLIALIGFVIPLGSIIGPLVIWLIKRDTSSFIDSNGRESLNFQISVAIYGIASAILILVGIGIILSIAVGIFWLVMTIIASVKANDGVAYRYPLTIRFL